MSLIAPLPWWRLPFATALTFHAKVFQRCQLCGVNYCQSLSRENIKKQCNTHWFNRIQFLCSACHNSINWQASQFILDLNSQNLQGLASFFYQYPYNKIMLEFKNTQQLFQLGVLIHALRQLDIPKTCHFRNSVIVRIPTTFDRIKERGFDPLSILTAYLSFHWQIPVFSAIGKEERMHQQGLTRDERLNNLKDAFYFLEFPKAKNIIIFDDVVTTGTTMQEIINLLLNFNNSYQIHARAMLHGRS